MKNTGLYYCRVNKDDLQNIGVVKKCLGQVKGFRELGVEMDMIWMDSRGALFNDRLIFEFNNPVFGSPHKVFHFYFFRLHNILTQKVDYSKYDFIYIRYELAHFHFIKWLQYLKGKYPKIKIVVEMPTYPYGKGLKGFSGLVLNSIDFLFRKKLNKSVDLVTNYGNFKSIYGIKAVTLNNAIAIDNVFVSNSKKIPNSIRLIAVGNWSEWHGLDRLIMGLSIYYKSKNHGQLNVSLKIVGSGKQLPMLVKLVEQFELKDYVKFYPPTKGEALDNLFDDSDIGVGSLAIHRIGLKRAYPLKHREFCARGLPFILSSPDPDFPEHIDWAHYCEVSDSPIDIDKVVVFYFNHPMKEMKSVIREYAERKLTWKKALANVIEEIKLL